MRERRSLRSNRDSSLLLGASLVRERRTDALVSAGNTGAAGDPAVAFDRPSDGSRAEQPTVQDRHFFTDLLDESTEDSSKSVDLDLLNRILADVREWAKGEAQEFRSPWQGALVVGN